MRSATTEYLRSQSRREGKAAPNRWRPRQISRIGTRHCPLTVVFSPTVSKDTEPSAPSNHSRGSGPVICLGLPRFGVASLELLAQYITGSKQHCRRDRLDKDRACDNRTVVGLKDVHDLICSRRCGMALAGRPIHGSAAVYTFKCIRACEHRRHRSVSASATSGWPQKCDGIFRAAMAISSELGVLSLTSAPTRESQVG